MANPYKIKIFNKRIFCSLATEAETLCRIMGLQIMPVSRSIEFQVNSFQPTSALVPLHWFLGREVFPRNNSSIENYCDLYMLLKISNIHFSQRKIKLYCEFNCDT